MYALIDCNNFYVSCERVFNPALEGKPVIVMGNNDGIIVARSNEVKALGIPMGIAVFEIREVIKRHNILCYSSNYTLYGEMSQCVIDTLRAHTSDVEVYSIDEVFADLSGFQHRDLEEYGHFLRKTVKQWTRIPVSIGIAPTKTLAKLANRIAKKSTGVVLLQEPDAIEAALAVTNTSDIWGIGAQWQAKLAAAGIHTALELSRAPDAWLRQKFNVVMLRTVHELRGVACIPWEDAPPPKKGIIVSKSFGTPITSLEDMLEAITDYTTRMGEKLRQEGRLARHMTIFLTTSRFKEPGRLYSNSVGITLPQATCYTPELIQYAVAAMKRIYRPGYDYKKCGIMLNDLSPAEQPQMDMLDTKDRQKQGAAMKALDAINQQYGMGTLFYAGAGIKRPWAMQRGKLSPNYMTEITDVPRVRA